MTNLTVGKLRKMLEGLSDDMEVIGWSDYYPGIADAENSGVQNMDLDMYKGPGAQDYFVIDGN